MNPALIFILVMLILWAMSLGQVYLGILAGLSAMTIWSIHNRNVILGGQQ